MKRKKKIQVMQYLSVLQREQVLPPEYIKDIMVRIDRECETIGDVVVMLYDYPPNMWKSVVYSRIINGLEALEGGE